MREIVLGDSEATIQLGEKLGALATPGSVIALRGELGAGKTTFAKGFARGLGIADEVTSPTYTIISDYEGRLRLHHVDAYRLGGPEDFFSVGGGDLLSDRNGVCIIEWSERIAGVFPPETTFVDFEVREDGSRALRFEGGSLEGLVP